MSHTTGLRTLLVAGLLAGTASGAYAAETVGVTAAVKGEAMLRSPGEATPRAATSGGSVLLDDQVTTGANSSVQLLLRDQTVFTVGADSAITVDRFVFDPGRSSGQLLANVVKGSFRYVSGGAAKAGPDAVSIKLPVGTIGVRGSSLVGVVGPTDTLVANTGPSDRNDTDADESAITVNGQPLKSGFYARVTPAGAIDVGRIDADIGTRINAGLGGVAAARQGAGGAAAGATVGGGQGGGFTGGDQGIDAQSESGAAAVGDRRNSAGERDRASASEGARQGSDGSTGGGRDGLGGGSALLGIDGFGDPTSLGFLRLNSLSDLAGLSGQTGSYQVTNARLAQCILCGSVNTVTKMLESPLFLLGPRAGSFSTRATVAFGANTVTFSNTQINVFGGSFPANFSTEFLTNTPRGAEAQVTTTFGGGTATISLANLAFAGPGNLAAVGLFVNGSGLNGRALGVGLAPRR